ncbi:hypothetical protein MCOR25_001230 [Pyricularia grisea]|uniref:SGNH hydrolase-type esterase domain-containing protein n=1 Tax=Pyricularia grisea TaxID=148305 RepID=A0A6P8AN42_PYRGI|nr:uncharacterized protein PgNI_11672 [Pyricularia grisea]KAI6381296.1 hypothetical protein MCOR25_001230 [Pyricularia grisea]TLD03444.1 hypothetical protein PgNI_11672 [Pyricularia grisea]
MQIKFALLSLLSATGVFAQDDNILEARNDKDKGMEKTNGAMFRIMPVGGAAIWGEGSSKGNAFRRKLREMIVEKGNPVNMVGSRKNGDFTDKDNEGWPDLFIDEIRDKAMRNESVPRFLPNIFLVNAGTKDAVKDKDIDKAGERYERLIKDLLDKSKDSIVIASTLIHHRNGDIDNRINKMNDQFKKVVEKLRKDKKKVLMVDMAGSDGPETKKEADNYSNDEHLNDKGYDKMASLWFKGLEQAAKEGWIKKPQWSLHCNGPKKQSPWDMPFFRQFPFSSPWFQNNNNNNNKDTCNAQDAKKITEQVKKINDQVKKDLINERPKWANDVEKKIIDELKKTISDLKNQIKDELKKELKCKDS